ncbi:MAG: glycosyltransferase [Bacteroidota bacterium]
MKILFLVPYPLGEAPSQRFRFEQYLPYLIKSNSKVTIKSFLDAEGWKVFYEGKTIVILLHLLKGFIKRTYHILLATEYDFIFIHREVTPIGLPVCEWFLAKFFRKKIIYDFDDAIWLRDPNESNLKSFIKCKWKVKYICKWSYKVSTGNKYLADYARNFNDHVIVNPTTVNTKTIHNPDLYAKNNNRNKRQICIGWTGTHSTLQYLSLVVPVLKRLEKKYKFIFRLVSNKEPDFSLKNLDFVQWKKETEIEDLMAIDIGIMPLADDQWSKGKCGFKALQYLALGKPALVSPVGINTQIIRHGVNGYHCKTEADWFKNLSYLLENQSICQSLGENGKLYVQKNYSVDSNVSNFLALFNLE